MTEPAAAVRRLLRTADRAALATVMRPDTAQAGAPYASLVLLALAQDATPLLLLSDLAEHTLNIRADARVSLLVDGTGGLPDALTGARATIQGRATVCDAPDLLARFVARHPGAAGYAGFADFHLYRVSLDSAHLVAGFGRIHWVEGDAVRCSVADTAAALATAESGIIGHMNADHADALRLYATVLLGLPDGAWTMTGIDPEGIDLRLEGRVARLAFDTPIQNAAGARTALAGLAAKAREAASATG
ncbi:MAG: HugZ family protein [Alphaproteobacteria bacterium]